MAPPIKRLEQYLAEGIRTPEGCLVSTVNKWGWARKVWTLAKGEIPAGKLVCHTCDNSRCYSLEHLFLGTSYDNIMDSVNKGRHSSLRLKGGFDQTKDTEERKKRISEGLKRAYAAGSR